MLLLLMPLTAAMALQHKHGCVHMQYICIMHFTKSVQKRTHPFHLILIINHYSIRIHGEE